MGGGLRGCQLASLYTHHSNLWGTSVEPECSDLALML